MSDTSLSTKPNLNSPSIADTPPANEADDKWDLEAKQILEQMSLEEKLDQLSGDFGLYKQFKYILQKYNDVPLPAGENKRLNIPALKFADGPRGVVCKQATCFPVSMARGAAFDVDLEQRIGDAIGVEMRSHGANYFGGVCINLLRNPAWGRAQETYGEDTHHLGELGAALVKGVQNHGMACIKHFALNSMENARFKVSVEVDERTLREVYLPHFKRCIDEGAASVMSAYNKVNNVWCGQHPYLLNDILKTEWGFKGIVISDFVFSVRNGPKALAAGMDIEMPYKLHFGYPLSRSFKNGKSSTEDLDRAVLRILKTKFAFRAVGEPERYQASSIQCKEHQLLAREAAQKSIVLLQNNASVNQEGETIPHSSVLPISLETKERQPTIAVIGRLAKYENIGDHGSSRVYPSKIVTPLEGIQKACEGNAKVLHNDGTNIAAASALAQQADYVVIIAGYTYKDEGEYILYVGGDRDSLALRKKDEQLINAVSKENANTIVSLIGGSAIVTEAWRENVGAILMAWYPGQEGGHAIADIIFGKVNPSGKLPCTFAKSERDLPFFDKKAKKIRYEYLHGYRLLDQNKREPAFHFGFGLSYTKFQYKDLNIPEKITSDGQSIKFNFTLNNNGKVDGEEIIQIYVAYPQKDIQRAPKDLKQFKKVKLKAGDSNSMELELNTDALRYYCENTRSWKLEKGNYKLLVGPSSDNASLLSTDFSVI